MKAARTLVGLLLLAIGAYAAVRFAPPSLAAIAVALAVAVGGAVLLAAAAPRMVAGLAALVLLGGGAALALALHEDLRGERRDEGDDPFVRRDDPRVHRGTGAWLLEADAEHLRFRAMAPDARVDVGSETMAKVTLENRGDRPWTAERTKERPLRVLIWGDCRGGVTVLERLCDAIATRKPDFSVGLGDFVGMARVYQFEILRDRLAATGVPVYLVPGNHDLDPFGSLRPYARVFGPTSWSFAVGDLLCIGADTADGSIDASEVDRIEGVLRSHPDASHVLLLMHHPLWAPPGRAEKPLPADDPATKRLKSLLVPERTTVFTSHWHGYDQSRHEGITQVVTGGAGSRLEYDGTHHYVWVELDGTGIRIEKVDLATPAEISATLDRWKTFRDEAFWAARRLPSRVLAPVAALVLGVGAALSALFRRRRVATASP